MKAIGIHAHYMINNGSDPAVSLFLKRKDISLKFCSPYAKVKATKLQTSINILMLTLETKQNWTLLENSKSSPYQFSNEITFAFD